MKLIRDIGTKLQGANEAMSAAKKHWQDDQLTARERAISLREEAVKSQLAEAKALNRASRIRNLKIGAGLVVVAVASFIAGNVSGRSDTGTSRPATAAITAAKPTPPPSSEPQPVEASARTAGVPPHQCIQRGVAYYKDIGAYPTLDAGVNAGKNADDVVRELCSRSLLAFGSE